MPLQDRFIFRFGFILTVIFISLILVNPRRSFAGDATDIRKLAEQGVADAQYRLGLIYYSGRGVPQDYKEAVRWHRKAAEQGYAKAQHELGRMYNIGYGVPP
jgi:TPR repeat protein